MKFVIALIVVIALIALYLKSRGASRSVDLSPSDAKDAALEADRPPPHFGANN